MTKESQKERTN